MMAIRPATEADLPLLRQWMRETPGVPAWSAEDLAASLAASDSSRVRRAWIAEDAAEIPLGFAVANALCFTDAPAECELEFVLVKPEARRHGLGGQLVAQVVGWARELQAGELRLEVRASNQAARRLYAASGFVETGRRRDYYAHPAEDAVLMRLVFHG